MDKNIIQFVADNSYFDFDSEEEDYSYEFSTRAHGSIFNEEYGDEDLVEAHRLKALILESFPNSTVIVDTYDEWVQITVE